MHTKEIPGTLMEEISFRKVTFALLMFQDKFKVLWIIDDNSRRQGRNGYLKCFETEYPLTLHKPSKELVTRSDE